MCVPCCNYSYINYITDDGDVKQEWLDKHYPKGSVKTYIQDSESPIAKRVWKLQGYFPQHLKVVDREGKIHDICNCPCHREGSTIMH